MWSRYNQYWLNLRDKRQVPYICASHISPGPISNTPYQACKGTYTPKINTGFRPRRLTVIHPDAMMILNVYIWGFFPLPAHCYVLAFFIFVSDTPSRPQQQTPPARTALPSGSSLPGFSTARTEGLPPEGLYKGIWLHLVSFTSTSYFFQLSFYIFSAVISKKLLGYVVCPYWRHLNCCPNWKLPLLHCNPNKLWRCMQYGCCFNRQYLSNFYFSHLLLIWHKYWLSTVSLLFFSYRHCHA